MRRLARLSLFWRVFLVDAAVVVLGVVLLAAGPLTISAPIREHELAALLLGLTVVLLTTLVLLHRTMSPLRQLTRTMRTIDPQSPGQRVVSQSSDADIAALTAAFNDMLDRLEAERRESTRMALSVQEGERQRVARELHDEVGQTLTAMLLQIEGLSTEVPPEVLVELNELRETARTGAEDVRRIAQRLRPEALEDLGLQSAMLALASTVADQAKIRIERQIDAALDLNREEELVVYRVAQEALTNIARHAEARNAELLLVRDDNGVTLHVADDGRGATAAELSSSYGVRGMRERASLIGAAFDVDSAPAGGTRVVLTIPRRTSA